MDTPNIIQFQVALSNNLNTIKSNSNNMNGYSSFVKTYEKCLKGAKGNATFSIIYTLLLMVVAFFLLQYLPEQATLINVVIIILCCVPLPFMVLPTLKVKNSFTSVNKYGLFNFYYAFISEAEKIEKQIANVDKKLFGTQKYLTIMFNLGDSLLSTVDILENIIQQKIDEGALDNSNPYKKDWENAISQCKSFINYFEDKGTDFLSFSQKYV